MDIWPDTSESATFTLEADVDLAGATAKIHLNGQWVALDWVAAPQTDGTTWTRSATVRARGETASTGSLVTDDDLVPTVMLTLADGQQLVRQATDRFDIRS